MELTDPTMRPPCFAL